MSSKLLPNISHQMYWIKNLKTILYIIFIPAEKISIATKRKNDAKITLSAILSRKSQASKWSTSVKRERKCECIFFLEEDESKEVLQIPVYNLFCQPEARYTEGVFVRNVANFSCFPWSIQTPVFSSTSHQNDRYNDLIPPRIYFALTPCE